MAEDTSAVSDVMQKGINAANTIRGAVKTGKAVAAAAKGGAVGGGFGAAAALIWENRGLVAAIIVGMVVILLIPVLIVSMLPSLIFNGTGETYSSSDTSNPIINSPTVIAENMEAISVSLDVIFNDGFNATLNAIEQDKLASSDNVNVEIILPDTDALDQNKSLLISQYCADKSDDYQNISISDFENVITSHKDNIYNFDKTERIETLKEIITTVDSVSGEEIKNIVVTEEKYIVYTVFYNGEEYFADNVFSLSSEQKELAKNYSENLSLFLSAGI